MTSSELSQPNVTVKEASPASYATRTLTVDFLFLDRVDCERCSGAEESLRDAIEAVADLLARLGVEIVVRNVHVEDEAAARRTRLKISPTIRIDDGTSSRSTPRARVNRVATCVAAAAGVRTGTASAVGSGCTVARSTRRRRSS